MEPEIRITDDGSQTLFLPSLKEGFHSRFGAVTESQHVFIESGLRALNPLPDPCSVLEIGFGTGLNLLLTLIESQKTGLSIVYHALEPNPLPQEISLKLNYPHFLNRDDLGQVFRDLHAMSPDETVNITPDFCLSRFQRRLQDFSFSSDLYHIIYFDAFSPETQPEMWITEHFTRLFSCLKSGGVLVTYCSKGTVKRSLTEAGFRVERLAGPPGKRHMLRARKS